MNAFVCLYILKFIHLNYKTKTYCDGEIMKTEEIESCIQKSVLLDMAFERHRAYLRSLKALVYFFYDTKDTKKAPEHKLPAQYLMHLISMMDQELRTICDLHTRQRETMGQYTQTSSQTRNLAQGNDQKQK